MLSQDCCYCFDIVSFCAYVKLVVLLKYWMTETALLPLLGFVMIWKDS